jgi:bla regulator protein blaR1
MSELSLIVKATFVLVTGLAILLAARRARASIRHLVLASMFGALIALPVAGALAPLFAIEVPIEVPAPRIGAFSTLAPADTATKANAGVPRSTIAEPGGVLPATSTMLWMAWALGALMLGGSLVLALMRLTRLTWGSIPWRDVGPLVSSLAAGVTIRRRVRVLLHEAVATPLTWGVLSHTIILPVDAPAWSDGDVRRALLHELEHIQRRDWLTQLIARAVCTAYWFHPLAWIALRRLSLEAERACDDAVIRNEERTEYADQLVTLAQRLRDAPHQVVLGMAGRSDLATRVSALLDGRQRRGRPGMLPTAAVMVAAVAAVLAIAPLRAVERPATRQPPPDIAPARLPAGLHRAPWASVVETLFGTPKPRSDAHARPGLALIEAAEDADIDGMNGLIAAGVDVNSAVDGDGSPLIAAARGGHVEAVQLLLDHGADVDMGVPGDGNPLIMAAHEGHMAVVELLLSRGATIATIVDGDENALIQASGQGHLAMVRLLVSRGADVNARAWAVQGTNQAIGEWRTPLNMALRGRHAAVADFLRSAGARE